MHRTPTFTGLNRQLSYTSSIPQAQLLFILVVLVFTKRIGYIFIYICYRLLSPDHFLYDLSFKERILVTVFSTCVFGSLPSDVELLNYIAPVMPLILEVDILLGQIVCRILSCTF